MTKVVEAVKHPHAQVFALGVLQKVVFGTKVMQQQQFAIALPTQLQYPFKRNLNGQKHVFRKQTSLHVHIWLHIRLFMYIYASGIGASTFVLY